MFGRLFGIALLCFGTSAWGAERTIEQVLAYVKKMDTAEAGFSQVSEDGAVHTGRLYIDRPGKMRFDYKTQDALILASAGAIAIFDGFDGKNVTQYPLRNTPLELLLGSGSGKSPARFIKSMKDGSQFVDILLRDDNRPEVGEITLTFSKNPMVLRKWVTRSESGEKTTVILQDLELGKKYSLSMFSIDSEKSRRGIRN